MNRRSQVAKGGAVKLRPSVTTVTATLPPMTLAQWYRLPAAVRYFHPWERARRALVTPARAPGASVDPQTKCAVDFEMGPGIKLKSPRQVPS